MTRVFLLVVFVIILSFLLPTSSLLLDCSIEAISFHRSSYPDGNQPLIQTSENDLGYSSGYSPFYVRNIKDSPDLGYGEIVLPSFREINIIPVIVTDGNNHPHVTNSRLFVNLTLGEASDAPYYPNITITFNDKLWINSAAESSISLVSTAGLLMFDLDGFDADGNNRLVIDASSAVHTTGSSSCTRTYVFNIKNSS